MEKRGVIAPGITPEEKNDRKNEKNSADEISRLDNDFRKRAAETVIKLKPAK